MKFPCNAVRVVVGGLKPQCRLLQHVKFIGNRTSYKYSTSSAATRNEHIPGHGQSTMNHEEISKFNNMSGQFWDLSGKFMPLHSMNHLRVPLIRDGLINTQGVGDALKKHRPLTGFKILDVGCGGGILSESLARLGAEVTGLDAGQEVIHAAQEHASLDPTIIANLRYIVGTVEEQAMKTPQEFDAVVASEVIEHVANQSGFLDGCIQLLKDNGSLFVTTINRTPCSYLQAILAAEYILGICPRGTHDWNMFMEPQEIQDIAHAFGCRTLAVRGMQYNPLCNTWSWSEDTSVDFAIHAVKI